MSIYRNIIEYVAGHINAKCATMDEARLAILQHLLKVADTTPLHGRGLERPYYPFRDLPISIDYLRKGNPPLILKRLTRRAAVERKLNAKAELALHALGLMDMPTAEKLAAAIGSAAIHEVNTNISTRYPFLGHRQRVTNVTCTVSNDTVATDDSPYAEYTRGKGVYLRITRRAMKDVWLPCPRIFNDHRKAIILDAASLTDGLIYVQWAGMRDRRSKQLCVFKGALCEDELVAGYDTEEDVLANEALIRAQARTMHVTRALTQGVEHEKAR